MLCSQRFVSLSALLSIFFMMLTPISVSAQDPDVGSIEESALDSMDELVSDLEEDLSDSDLEQAVQADAPQAEEPSETEAEPAATDAEAAVKPAKKPGAKRAKPNAIITLRADQDAKVWINGRYRGKLKAKKKRAFPIKAGRIKISAKSKSGVVRRFVKRVKPKSRVSTHFSFRTKAAGKGLKGKVGKGTKRSKIKAAKRAKGKKAVKRKKVRKVKSTK